MGIPGLIVTEKMVPDLQEILESAGIKVEKETFPDQKEIVGHAEVYGEEVSNLYQPSFSLNCEHQEGYKVRLSFGRASMKPYYLGLAIRPEPQTSFLRSLVKKPGKNILVDEIIAVLKKHGAKDLNFYDKENGNMKCSKKNGKPKKDKTVMDLSWILNEINFDLDRYQELKEEGKTASEAYSIAKAEGLNPLDCMKMLSKVYRIPFLDTKEFIMKINYNCNSLSEYQEKHILPMLENYFETENPDTNT